MEESFKTKGTCATTIQFTRDGDKIRNTSCADQLARAVLGKEP
jgi:hypothetical protein